MTHNAFQNPGRSGPRRRRPFARCGFHPELPSAYIGQPRPAEPYPIEAWCEKSTANDILVPLAQRLNITLVTGLGELHCHWHVARVLAGLQGLRKRVRLRNGRRQYFHS